MDFDMEIYNPGSFGFAEDPQNARAYVLRYILFVGKTPPRVLLVYLIMVFFTDKNCTTCS